MRGRSEGRDANIVGKENWTITHQSSSTACVGSMRGRYLSAQLYDPGEDRARMDISGFRSDDAPESR